jgi:hypothetical protein
MCCNYRIPAAPYKLDCLQVYYCEYIYNDNDDGDSGKNK